MGHCGGDIFVFVIILLLYGSSHYDFRCGCVLGVFLYLVYTCLAHEYKDLLEREREGVMKDHMKGSYRGFPTRMVYLHYISYLRYTILVGNPQYER